MTKEISSATQRIVTILAISIVCTAASGCGDKQDKAAEIMLRQEAERKEAVKAAVEQSAANLAAMKASRNAPAPTPPVNDVKK